MKRKSLGYGLKERYNFKEIHVPVKDLAMIHNTIIDNIGPSIIELETSKLINGFHFILNDTLDFRISTDNWKKNEKRIKEILVMHGLPVNLTKWESLPPGSYGGTVGVLLCYNNLEFNSRLIAALLRAQRDTKNPEVKAKQERLVYSQWVHHLYIQYGLTNAFQIKLEFQDSLAWLRSVVENTPDKKVAKSFGNKILGLMRDDIDRFSEELNE